MPSLPVVAPAHWVMGLVGLAVALGLGVGVFAVWQLAQPAVPGQSPIAAFQSNWAHWLQDVRFMWGTRATADPNLRQSSELDSVASIAQAYAQWREDQSDDTLASDEATITGQYRQLLKHAPGLESVIRYRHSQWQQQHATEWQLQQTLLPLASQGGQLGLPALRYALAQSMVRANQPAEAKAMLDALITAAPQSEEALGARYYRMEQAFAQGDMAQAAQHGWAYLEGSPTGTFAGTVAQRFVAQSITPSNPQQQWALVLAAATLPDIELLQQASTGLATTSVGWMQAKGLAAAGDNPFDTLGPVSVVVSLVTSPRVPTEGDVDDTLALLRQYLPLEKQAQALSEALRVLPANARMGDRLWWRLAVILEYQGQRSAAVSASRMLAQRYPSSAYAAESQKTLLMPLWRQAVVEGSIMAQQQFVDRASRFVQQYPHANSAVWLGYWQAKVHEAQGQKEQAIQTYLRLVRDYPETYYGMRAQHRLAVLRNQQPDPLWTLPTPWAIPTQEAAEPSLAQLLPQLEGWSALPAQAQSMVKTLAMLADTTQSAAVAEDVVLVLHWALEGHVDEAEKNWVNVAARARFYAWTGQPNRAIRLVYDATKARSRDGHMDAYHPPKGWLQLMYPVAYASQLLTRSEATGVHPWLGMALMRQESFFNPKAVSSSDARGLMQLLVPTAREVAGWEGIAAGFTGNQLFEPETNVRLGMRYLQFLFEKFQPYGPALQPMMAAAAYNGGPNAMASWAAEHSTWLNRDADVFVELIPYDQSREYVYHVLGGLWHYQRLYGAQSNGG